MDAFLETTAMVDLIFKDAVRRATIEDTILGCQTKYSSEYVRMEMKRGVLSYWVLLYNKCVECEKLSEVFEYIQRLGAGPARNRASSILESLALFFKSVEDESVGVLGDGALCGEFVKAQIAAFLRTRIRHSWRAFEKEVDVVLDDVGCFRGSKRLEGPRLVNDRFENSLGNCDDNKPEGCGLRDFLERHRTECERVLGALTSLKEPDSETSRRVTALKEVLRVCNRPVSRTNCWRLGDVNLALEAPVGSAVVTHNRKHFEPICAAIGKGLLWY
jgi:hypothetical protein